MQSHFFGSIVATKASEVEDDLLIIDGQQRITTLSLLILAAFNAVANGDMQPGNEDIEEVISKGYTDETWEDFIKLIRRALIAMKNTSGGRSS